MQRRTVQVLETIFFIFQGYRISAYNVITTAVFFDRCSAFWTLFCIRVYPIICLRIIVTLFLPLFKKMALDLNSLSNKRSSLKDQTHRIMPGRTTC